MSLIQLGQKFRVRDSYKGSYLLPGETFVTLSQTDTGRIKFTNPRGPLPRQLPVSLLEHLIATKEIVLIEEPAKPMPQTAAQVEVAMRANALRIRTSRGEALDAIGRINGLLRRDGEPDNVFQHRIHKVATAGPTDLRQYNLKSRLEGPEGLGLKDAHAAMYKFQAAYPAFSELAATKTPVEFEGLHPSEFVKQIATQSEIKHQMENHPMSKVRIVDVFLFDDTPGLKAEDRLIAKYEGITTDGSDTDVIVDLALNHNIKEQLANHNEKRAKTVNEDLLNRVGKKVMLLPLEAKQIEYRIKPVVQL